MIKSGVPKLYHAHFVAKGDERLGLFRLLAGQFDIGKGIYPGSFCHITPSFVVPEMVYVDSDKRCPKFFAAEQTMEFVCEKKEYAAHSVLRFHAADFTDPVPEDKDSFDLLISLYAGFVSQHCKSYLKTGGILLANNSHGDASLAYLDPDLLFIGVVKRSGDTFRLVLDGLDAYFQTKTGKPIDRGAVERTMRGAGFTKTGYAYLFEKVGQQCTSET
ncbi:MAG: hypothetical protein JXA89_13970 [Anaerolineae bacterium]|nr:hypothetical protein [Anaerolineae bacterium]